MARKLLVNKSKVSLIFTTISLLIMVTMIPAIAEEKTESKVSKPYGGTLVWGTRNRPTIINPILTTFSVSSALMELIFNQLVRRNSKGEIEPDLAELWNISEDGLTYTFYLKKGVRFHDGTECTAHDVKFTYDAILNPDVKSPFRSLYHHVKDFKVIDKHIIRITLKNPLVYFIDMLIRDIVPKHLLEGKDLRNCDFNLYPIGTGPFKFKEWRDNNGIVLEYNPDYHEGRPYLDKIIVKTYPNIEDVWTALMRGEVDFGTFIGRENYEIVMNDPSFKAFAVPQDYYYGILYNLDDPILSDRKVRYAIAHGINREEMIRRVVFGYGLECKGPFYPDLLGFNPEVQPFEYNPEKASELLEKAGWRDSDNDGILEKDKEELELRILVDSRTDVYKRIAMFVRQRLKEIGIKTKVVLYSHEDMLGKEFLEANRPQAHLKRFLGGIDPGLVGEEWRYQASGRMFRLWPHKNEAIERLLELGEGIRDEKERKEVYREVHRIIYEDQPASFLFFPLKFHAVSSKFENVDDFFNVSMPHYTQKDWFIKNEE